MSTTQPTPAPAAANNAKACHYAQAVLQEALARATRERYHGSISVTVNLRDGTITHVNEDTHRTRRTT
ncbi:MAG: hypothetical protein AB7U73_01285 [Pirellulales bacterium]